MNEPLNLKVIRQKELRHFKLCQNLSFLGCIVCLGFWVILGHFTSVTEDSTIIYNVILLMPVIFGFTGLMLSLLFIKPAPIGYVRLGIDSVDLNVKEVSYQGHYDRVEIKLNIKLLENINVINESLLSSLPFWGNYITVKTGNQTFKFEFLPCLLKDGMHKNVTIMGHEKLPFLQRSTKQVFKELPMPWDFH